MNRILSFFLTAAVILVSAGCEFDDSQLWSELNSQKSELTDHAKRIASLEQQCAQMNTNISSIQSILTALQNNDYVTGVTNVMQGNEVIGYTISFSKSAAITIYHGRNGKDGKDGEDGEDGRDGTDGTNGTNGVDGVTPVISVRLDTDGLYYWTLNGEWLLDASGKKVPAQGRDGIDGKDGEDGAPGQPGTSGNPGKDGKDGKDGRTPQLKIEDGFWFVSYDGTTWTKLGKAQGEQGQTGPQGPQGPAGVGIAGDSMFTGVDTSNTDYVLFTLSGGTTIKLPTWSAFEALQTACNKLNTNVEGLQAIVAALENNVYVTAVVPVMENGKKVGYSILFSSGEPVTIYNGQDGKDGSDGVNGTNGINGTTPVIGVKDFGGTLYWTVNGEWLLDGLGNKVKAEGRDGQDGSSGSGSSGQDGKDGVTPKLRINSSTNFWEVSYDNGSTWTSLGVKATGEQGPQGNTGPAGSNANCVFSNVIINDSSVTFVLTGGTTFTLPMGSPEPAVTDLSAGGTANCYIVTRSGKYSFPTVKGNSSNSVSQVSSAVVLWETFGTYSVPEVGDLVSDVRYSNNTISFTASDNKGNAVIAAKDRFGNILWSWHIWMTDQPEEIRYQGNAGKTLDRNLGASSVTPGDIAAIGLIYQWGRKDPFLSVGGPTIIYGNRALSTNNSSWTEVTSDASIGTNDYAIAHPTTFIIENSLNKDWYYTGSSTTDNNRWMSTKGVYDPCPAGYRIPDGGPNGIWAKSLGTANIHYYSDSGIYDKTNIGVNIKKLVCTTDDCWYPSSGYVKGEDGSFYNHYKSLYWSCTPADNNNAYSFSFNDMNVSSSYDYHGRAYAAAVRCQKQ